MDCISKLNLLNYLLLTSSKYACKKKRKKFRGPKRPERRNQMKKVSKIAKRVKEAIAMIGTLSAFAGRRIDVDDINNEFERLYNSQERRLDSTVAMLKRLVDNNTDVMMDYMAHYAPMSDRKEDRDNG